MTTRTYSLVPNEMLVPGESASTEVASGHGRRIFRVLSCASEAVDLLGNSWSLASGKSGVKELGYLLMQ